MILIVYKFVYQCFFDNLKILLLTGWSNFQMSISQLMFNLNIATRSFQKKPWLHVFAHPKMEKILDHSIELCLCQYRSIGFPLC